MIEPMSGRPVSWKAYVVGVLVFNMALALVMYVLAAVFQWGLQ